MEVLNLMSAVMSIVSNAVSNGHYRRTGAIPTLAVVHRQLGMVALLHGLAQAGSQAIVATHLPIVAACPGRPSWNWATEACAWPGGTDSTWSTPGDNF